MKKNTDRLVLLNQRLAQLPGRKADWGADDGRRLTRSQVWSVAGGCGDQPTWLWLVLECVGAGLCNALPLFRWGELAGPEDVYVPKEWAGSTLIVSFELEYTLARSALGECLGRLPGLAMRYIGEAKADVDHPVRRNAHNWGLGYLDSHDRRLAYHEAIATAIEQLQVPVRSAVFASPQILAFPVNLPFSGFRSAFEALPALAAADSGEAYSACLVVDIGNEPEPKMRPESSAPHWARNLSFDPLIPGSREPICCEWSIGACIEDAVGAVVYAPGIDYPIGNALVSPRDDATLIVLNEVDMPAEAQPVHEPTSLKIVVLVQP